MKKFFARKKVQLVTADPVTGSTVTKVPSSLQIPWQRMIVSLFGILILMATWRWSVNHLYTLPVTSITAFTSITNNYFYAVTILVVWFVTNKLVFDWKNATVSQVVQQAQSTFEEKTERVIKPKYLDDASIP